MPHDETTVGRRDEKPIVDIRTLTCYCFGKHNTHNKAKAPVEPAGYCRHDSHKGYRSGGTLGQAGHGIDGSFDNRCSGQGRPAHKNQGHLHGKRQQIPHAATPVLYHLEGSLVTQWHRHQRCHEGEQDGEYKRFRQPSLH